MLAKSIALAGLCLAAAVRGRLEDDMSMIQVKVNTLLAGEPTSLRPNAADIQQRRFAWIISGQLPRFIYRDSTSMLDGGISGFIGCNGYQRGQCPATVDVHVVLSNTHASPHTGPRYVLPSYGDHGFEESSVTHHYASRKLESSHRVFVQKVEAAKKEIRSLGANHVRFRVLSSEDFDQAIQTVTHRIMQRGMQDNSMTKESWDNYLRKIPKFRERFSSNGNMMYLRHLAYKSAMDFEQTLPSKYTHFLYTREDNIFVHPKYTLLQWAQQIDGAPAVMVDKHCSFGSHSDKIYFANRKGFESLFPRTEEQHVRIMANWLTVGAASGPRGDPLQSEAFFTLLMETAHVAVTVQDFNRTEARYEARPGTGEPIMCTPKKYSNCTGVPIGACP